MGTNIVDNASDARWLRDLNAYRNDEVVDAKTITQPFLHTILFTVCWCAAWAYSKFCFSYPKENVELFKKTCKKLIARGFKVKPNYRECKCLVSWA